MSSSSADRAVRGIACVVVGLAILARLHAVVAWPAIHDWDASGHAVNVVDLREGHLPDPRSWCGSHPPLYYALGAVLWAILPDGVPVHQTLRLLSVAAWTATVGLVWGWLRRRVGAADAAVAAALLFAVPGFTIASVMMTNDALCAFFVTAALLGLLATAGDRVPTVRAAAAIGAIAGLAALSKATGVAIVGWAGLTLAWRARRDPKRAVPALLVFAVVSGALALPHYGRLFLAVAGSPYDVLAVRAGSQEKEVIATVVEAVTQVDRRGTSPVALFVASLWGDPTAVFLPRGAATYGLSRALVLGGAFVAAVLLAGLARVLARRDLLRANAAALLFGVAYAGALVPHAISRPYIVLTKTNYVMLEALPLAILLVSGLAWARGMLRIAVHAMLLLVAVGGLALTTYGWWRPAAAAPAPPALVRTEGAAGAVERWFVERARDPMRALERTLPALQRRHDLRLVRILGLPPLAPEPAVSPEAAASLELARARVAWLELYNLVPWFQPIASRLVPTVLDVREQDTTADVRLRVEAAGSTPPPAGTLGPWPFPPFEERMTLVRDGREWRIAAIEQDGVSDASAVAAFVANPTWAGYERLRALGWRPPWELGIAAARGAAAP